MDFRSTMLLLTNADSMAVVHLLAVCSRVRRRSAHGSWTDSASQSPSTSLMLAISGWLQRSSQTNYTVDFFMHIQDFQRSLHTRPTCPTDIVTQKKTFHNDYSSKLHRSRDLPNVQTKHWKTQSHCNI